MVTARAAEWIFLAADLTYRDLVGALGRAISESGFIVMRSEGNPLLGFRETCARPYFSMRSPILIGVAEKADLLAKSYYDFFALNPPEAMILISPSVGPAFLNNLTCPYLLLHGSEDVVLRTVHYEQFEEAVHHHQMRYGDATTLAKIQGVGRDLGGNDLSPRAVGQLLDWLRRVTRQARKTGRAA